MRAYGRGRGRRIAPPSAARRHKRHCESSSSRFAASSSTGPTPDGGEEHSGRRHGHQPPRGDTVVCEPIGRRQRDGDARGDAPVVADDEVDPEAEETLHVGASLRRRRPATNVKENARTAARTTGSAASSPGQRAPAPSVLQKIPNVVSIVPTANFSAFSGTRERGARTATPTAATRKTAIAAPRAASGMLPCVEPNVRTINATSRPSRKTPLKETVNPYQSRPSRSSEATA